MLYGKRIYHKKHASKSSIVSWSYIQVVPLMIPWINFRLAGSSLISDILYLWKWCSRISSEVLWWMHLLDWSNKISSETRINKRTVTSVVWIKLTCKRMPKHSKNTRKNISYGIIFITFYVCNKKMPLISQEYSLISMRRLVAKMWPGSQLCRVKVNKETSNKLWKN